MLLLVLEAIVGVDGGGFSPPALATFVEAKERRQASNPITNEEATGSEVEDPAGKGTESSLAAAKSTALDRASVFLYHSKRSQSVVHLGRGARQRHNTNRPFSRSLEGGPRIATAFKVRPHPRESRLEEESAGSEPTWTSEVVK